MKKLFCLTFSLLFFITSFAQSDVAKFVGIPLKQSKDIFIKELINKGFSYKGKKDVVEEKCDAISLIGKFWKFETCEATVAYSVKSDSVVYVSVFVNDYTSNRFLFRELMDNLDLKYGPRTLINEDEYETEYRWLSEQKSYMVQVAKVYLPSVDIDFISIRYYSEEETQNILKKELSDWKSDFDDL